jgi:hypothetical protein
MYVLGLPFGRRRKSSFLDGVGPDAVDLSAHLARHLASPRSTLVVPTELPPAGRRADRTGSLRSA